MGLLKVKVMERSGGTGVIKVVAREAKGRDHGMTKVKECVGCLGVMVRTPRDKVTELSGVSDRGHTI